MTNLYFNQRKYPSQKIRINANKLMTLVRGLGIAEQIPLIGTVLGGLTAAVSGQIIYASLPLSLSLILFDNVRKKRYLKEVNTKTHLLPRKKLPVRGKDDRVAIFIDAANLYYSAAEQKVNIDYSSLLSTLKAESKQCQVFFYTGIDPHDEKQKHFIFYLCRQGFKIVSKNIVARADGSYKANMDVELALDLIDLSDSYDTAILVSGDGDFQDAVKRLQSRGKKVEVASFSCSASNQLITIADSFFNLQLIYSEIARFENKN